MMEASTTKSRGFALVGCIALTVAACAGQTEDAPKNVTTPPGADSGATSANGGDSGSISPDPPGSTVGDAGKTAKPKAIGSPCSADSDCDASLTCNQTFTGGLCTKACASDAECGGKQGALGACIDALCFAACSVDADAGTSSADAGKPKGPCKNKAFQCVSVPGEAEPICVPPQGSGGDASTDATSDVGTPGDSGASD